LPAELLSQGPSGPARRATVEIDANRLLTRVARAFTAAQDRDGEVRLRLSPPELGSLRLEVRVQDGAMVAHIQTETDAAKTAILDNLPTLRDRLADQGVRIERFDVDLMQRQPGGGGMPDQPGSRQQDSPAAALQIAPSPRPRTEVSVSQPTPAASVDSMSGLNVII
jgi:flagellar hook-length control protein FliK